MEESVAVNINGNNPDSGSGTGSGAGSGSEASAADRPDASTSTRTDSSSASADLAAAGAIAPSTGTGGLISILKALETEKSLATDPVVVALRYFPSTQASFAPLPDDLSPKLAEYLKSRGLEQLYAHQRVAYDLAKAGKSFVVTTPTASGKTLC